MGSRPSVSAGMGSRPSISVAPSRGESRAASRSASRAASPDGSEAGAPDTRRNRSSSLGDFYRGLIFNMILFFFLFFNRFLMNIY